MKKYGCNLSAIKLSEKLKLQILHRAYSVDSFFPPPRLGVNTGAGCFRAGGLLMATEIV